jgi:2-methylisocitrate lyase-like PEP mutase family enzyme
MTPADGARALRALHRPGTPVLLPNAWDAASALRFAALGHAALATSSAAIADALGHEDAERTPPDEMLAAVARIAAAVDVPVTADLEAGYGLPADTLVHGLLAAGAVGVNLEDSDHGRPGELVDADRHADRLAAVKAAGRAAGVDIVLNARVDVHLRRHGRADRRLETALARARLYRDAGADCVFPIMVSDDRAIAAFVDAAQVVNVLLHAGAPTPSRLAELGVARLTFGSGLAGIALEAAAAHLQRWTAHEAPRLSGGAGASPG